MEATRTCGGHIGEEVFMADEKKTYKFVCTVCGYEVEVDTPELPEDFVCPVCGVGPDMFEKVED
jgi:Rubredoxin